MTYTVVTNEQLPHLGGNVLEGDPYTFTPNVWNYMIDRFSVRSVLDLGSGLGYSASFFHKKGCQVVAVDGLEENCKNAKYPTVNIDLTNDYVKCHVDLVHCQEVVEHIDEQYLENVLRSLSCGRIILMSHALPGQDGYHHVNAQSSEYWIHHLSRYNYHYLPTDTDQVRKIAANENGAFLAMSGLVFSRKD